MDGRLDCTTQLDSSEPFEDKVCAILVDEYAPPWNLSNRFFSNGARNDNDRVKKYSAYQFNPTKSEFELISEGLPRKGIEMVFFDSAGGEISRRALDRTVENICSDSGGAPIEASCANIIAGKINAALVPNGYDDQSHLDNNLFFGECKYIYWARQTEAFCSEDPASVLQFISGNVVILSEREFQVFIKLDEDMLKRAAKVEVRRVSEN